VLRVTLSGWENGRHCPGPLYRRLLAEALEMTEADLGFGSAGRPDRAPSLPAGPELLNYLETVLTQHIQADRTIGSYYLINVVQEHLKVIELCLHDTRSPARDDFLSLANRFAELCGWLNQDQRRYADAERWTSKAQLLADAWRDWPTGHNRDRALCLARLAEVHAEMGDPDQACHIGGQALQAVRLAPSERTAASLRALRGALMPYRARAEVVELRQLVAEALP
jgi:hypothetical protein